MIKFKDSLVDVAKCYEYNGGGPWLYGNQLSHADFIIGGWLKFYENGIRPEEFQELKSWYGGLLGRIHDALKPYAAKVN